MRARRPQVGVVLTAAQHRAGRLAFAREHQDWQIRHWRPVLFTDESRFTLSTCDRRDRVWRRRGERSAACNILQHDRFGSGSVMVWGGISLGGRTALHVLARGSLTAIRYRDEILRPLVRPYAGAVGPGFLLMQDNARPHVAGVCQQFLQDEGIDAMDWPARSPDLNPIEHIWDIMSRSIHQCQRHVAPQTVQELADALVQIWLQPVVNFLKISFCAPSVWMCSLIQSPYHVDTTSAKTASMYTGISMSRGGVPCAIKVFTTKPELFTNTFISEMVAQFREEAQQEASSSSSSEQQVSKPGEVPCDVCTGTKLKALKSCLVCLVSYCETHLEPHLTVSGLKRHQLMEPVENLEGRMYHKTHEFVPLREEYEGRKLELEAEIQYIIQERQQSIERIKESVERGLNELIEVIEEKQKTTEKQAEDSIKKLEQEISELMKRRTEVEELSQSEDHLHLLQSVQSLNIHHPPPTKDWTEVSVCPLSHDGTVRRAVAQLEETLSKEMKKLVEAELKKVQQYAVDVTLDPDTAHPNLILSEDGKQVSDGGVRKNLPNNAERFSVNPCVLGKQSFSSGRFYYEVQVKGKTEWDLGVARESIVKKEDIPLSPEEGYWTIWLRRKMKYKALADPPVSLSLKSRPQKVGVFVDYEEGVGSAMNQCEETEEGVPPSKTTLCGEHDGQTKAQSCFCQPAKIQLYSP
ncbi:hypothetical protein L3Q82_005540 [Scortum barcoo]|uniref:Uncharacterized protein n=1 Tax=Scortum barcoo TaxID=214431 RepID=A0ACB8VAT2_9TELE|nr:hypothetical protein L3Q82_005540 [Scortum barcoo]